MGRKMRIGIITITNDGYNYGNRLQNYALQHVLEHLGFQVETLNRPLVGNQRLWYKHKRRVFHFFFPFRQTREQKKSGSFFFWNLLHIKWSPILVSDECDWSYIQDRYDFFVAGSDQIWNPNYFWGKDPYMFLQFAKESQRIAYAPSFGIDKIEDEDTKGVFSKFLHNWKALSCREKSGSHIAGVLTNREIPCLLDPTLLLKDNEWIKISRFGQTPRKRYIFLYVLGEMLCEYQEFVHHLAEEKNCKIVDIMNNNRYFGSSPSRFLSLIRNADYVVSDSYHAFVFSVIFHKPFIHVDRSDSGTNMNDRFLSLSQKLEIDFETKGNIGQIGFVDWEIVEKRLQEERELSVQYLKQALEI